jgi:hypothetical protein
MVTRNLQRLLPFYFQLSFLTKGRWGKGEGWDSSQTYFIFVIFIKLTDLCRIHSFLYLLEWIFIEPFPPGRYCCSHWEFDRKWTLYLSSWSLCFGKGNRNMKANKWHNFIHLLRWKEAHETAWCPGSCSKAWSGSPLWAGKVWSQT